MEHVSMVSAFCDYFFFNLYLLKFGTSIILKDFYHGYLLLQDEFPECDSISDISSDIEGNVAYISHEDLDNDSSSVSSIKGTGIQMDWSLLWWKNLKNLDEVLFFLFFLIIVNISSIFFFFTYTEFCIISFPSSGIFP